MSGNVTASGSWSDPRAPPLLFVRRAAELPANVVSCVAPDGLATIWVPAEISDQAATRIPVLHLGAPLLARQATDGHVVATAVL